MVRRSTDAEVQGQQVVFTDRATDVVSLAPLDGRSGEGRARDLVTFPSALGGSVAANNEIGQQLSPDGRELLLSAGIERSAGGRRLGLVIVNVATGAVRQLTTDPTYHDDTPAWSPDGSLIAFSRQVVNGGDAGIWIIRPDGTALRRVLEGSPRPGARSFVYSCTPDNRYIAFASGTTHELFDIAGGATTRGFGEHFFVLRGNADWRRPTPQFIGAFSEGERGGAQRIDLADGPGSRPRTVVTAPAASLTFLLSPRWRPSSEDFLYRQVPASQGGGAPTDSRLMVASAAGGTPRQVFAKPFIFHAEWTPAGTEIAWVEAEGVGVAIRVVRPDGSGERAIHSTGGAPEARVRTLDFGTLRF